MEYQFKKGDVVKLRSGGPDMTIKSIVSKGPHPQYAVCNWFVEGEFPLQELEFPFATLELVKEAPTAFKRESGVALSKGPLPSEAFRVKFMEVALKFATDPDDFFRKYVDLLFTARHSLELGSLAFLGDPSIAQKEDLHNQESK